MDLFLGIDLGTSSVKVALINGADFTVIQSSSAEYPIFGDQPGYAEQNLADWWNALVKATQSAVAGYDPKLIRGIGLDGQMHGVVCMDKQGQAIRPALIWADTRSTTEVQELFAIQPNLNTTLPGGPSTGFAAASLRWLSKHEPQTIHATATVLTPKDAVRALLTGEFASEPSDASATWLFDIEQGTWSAEVTGFCGLRLDQLPEIKRSSDVAGGLTATAARALGLLQGTPVVTGCADLPAQALGHGIIKPGKLFVTVGSGGQVFTALDHLWLEPKQTSYTFNHAVDEKWYAQTAMLSAGLSLRWLRDLLNMQTDPAAYANLSQWASEVPAGCEGLIFLPYLSGERTLHNDPNAAGLFLGLRLHHTVGHMARAVMEGVCFGLLDCINLLPSESKNEIVLSGGISKSNIWTQIAADVWQIPLKVVSETAAPACVGGAMLASVGTSYYQDISATCEALTLNSWSSEPRRLSVYQERYEQFLRLYPLLKEEMHALTRVGNE